MTWIQPEDLVGHELRQAREEGKDVDALERRWIAAGGAPAPSRGASPEPAPPELRALALELLDEAAAIPRPLAAQEPDEVEPAPVEPFAVDPSRVAGAWLGRAVGCVLGKPVENIPREGIRAIAEATGNWPVSRWFTAEGLDPAVSERWPWNRASRSTSLAENIDGIPEDDDLNFTMLGLALLERSGTEFDSLDVAKIWLDRPLISTSRLGSSPCATSTTPSSRRGSTGTPGRTPRRSSCSAARASISGALRRWSR